MTDPTPERPESPSEVAAAVVDEWERLESQSMRSGPRYTLENLIVSALDSARQQGRKEGLEEAAKWHEEKMERCAAKVRSGLDTMGLSSLLWQAHEDAAECIRALEEKPNGECLDT